MLSLRRMAKPLTAATITFVLVLALVLVPAQLASATTVNGTIDSVGTSSIVVDGQTILIGPDTVVDGTLAVGKSVKVVIKGKDKGSLLAHRIKVEDKTGYGN